MILVQLRGWSYNTSRDVCTYIHPENTTTVLNPRNICSDSPYLLIIVCSAVDNVNARVAIRNTWGNQSNLDMQFELPVRIAFLLGQSDNDTLNVSHKMTRLWINKIVKFYYIFIGIRHR